MKVEQTIYVIAEILRVSFIIKEELFRVWSSILLKGMKILRAVGKWSSSNFLRANGCIIKADEVNHEGHITCKSLKIMNKR